MSTSPDRGTEGLVTYTIYSEGAKIRDSFGIISISVHKEVNRIGKATIVISAGDMPAADVPESNDDSFIPGKAIRIEAGYNSSGSMIFEGTVISHSLEIAEDNETVLRIECRDYAFPATQVRKNHVFENMGDNAVIQKILGNYSSLNATIDSTTGAHGSLVQYQCTDWDFILSRADANGLVVIPDGRSIKVIKPVIGASPVLSVTYGMDLIAFSGTLNSASQPVAVEAICWDAASQQVVTASGSSPSVNAQGNIDPVTLAGVNKQKKVLQTTTAGKDILKSWADAQWLKAAMGRYSGTIKFQGSAKAVPGCIIELKGLGARFNGNAYSGSVTHEISDGNWYTTVGMGISPENITDSNNVSAPPASGLLAGINGLQVGKVVKLDGDPEGEDRIQVEIPLLNDDKNNVWARLASFWASSDHGAFFIPDVGDEVVLGFFNDNPCHAVVLGSLYSSSRKPSSGLTAKNDTRSIVTKSKMKIVFDEEKKIITLATPGKNTVEINDDGKSIRLSDQNSNSITMSESGITIDSAKSLILKAATGILINAGEAVDIKGTSGIIMKAPNIEATADIAFTAKGNAQAELSATGNVTVRGAMVMIN